MAGLFLLLRWNNFNAPLIRDEGEYAYAAQVLKSGGAPYQDAFIQKPPMIVYTYWLADMLLPAWYWGPRVLAALFVAAATALLGFVARREFGQGFALPVVALATPMILLPNLEQFTANTEMFLLLPLLCVFALYTAGRLKPPNACSWFAAGLLAATALLYKYTALPILMYLLAIWLVEMWRAGAAIRTLGACVGALTLGGMVAAGIELGFFLHRDGARALWDCTVTFNRHYLASDNFGWIGIHLKLRSFLSSWWIMFLLPAAAFLKPHRRLWFWFGALACAAVATGGSYYGQYYILLMPFWALVSVMGIHALTDVCATRSHFPSGRIRCALTGLALALILWPDAPWMTLPANTFAAAKFAHHSVFLESPLVGQRIAQLTSPAEPIWVAASEPQILDYAHRKNSTRFITMYALVIPSPELPDYQAQAIQAVRANPPRLIVWAHSWLQDEPQPSACLLFLTDLLAHQYRRVGGYVLAGAASRWCEPLAEADVPAASVIVYERTGGSPGKPLPP